MFVRIETGSSGALYGAEPATAPTWSGYYLPAEAVEGPLPESIEPAAAWGFWGEPRGGVNGGTYLFCAGPPPQGSADALAALLKSLNQGFGGWAYRFLIWIPVPSTLPLKATAALPFAQATGEDGTLVAAASVPFRTLSLGGDRGLTVSFDPAVRQLALAPAGRAGLHLIQSRGSPVEVGTVTGPAALPLTGAAAGRLALSLQLNVSGIGVQDDLGHLVTGVKYFYEHKGLTKSQLFRLLGVPEGSSRFGIEATLDPLHPTDESRTRLSFAADAGPFGSPLRTITGAPLALAPLAGSSGLVLAGDRVTDPTGKQIDSYYATLSGPFALAGQQGSARLLCGLSGMESLAVELGENGDPADRLVFHPGQPAQAPAFPPPAASLDDPGAAGLGKPLLDGKMTTAWAAVESATSPPAPCSYYAQPSGAPLFATGAADTAGLLELLDQPAGEARAAFPLAAYDGAAATPGQDGFDPALLAVYEQAAIAPTRRATITTEPPLAADAAAAAGASGAATPQGFLVELAGSAWTSLLMARTATGELSFAPVEPALQAALQTDQLFLVASRMLAGFKGSIDVEGWPFEIAVGEDQSFGAYSNVLIFKFCDGPLRDLVANPRRWTAADSFNATADDGLLALSQWLQDYLAAAAASADDALTRFNQLAADPAWKGVLALRVNVPLADLPSQVGALRCGIEGSKLAAHHLGVEVNQLTPDGTALRGQSSLFGLIDYTDPAYAQALRLGTDPETAIPAAPGLTYDFKVLRLLALFENSEIKRFRSISQVTLTQWFGDPVIAPPQLGGVPPTSIVLDGSLQNHDGQPVYAFASRSGASFEIDSKALQSVAVATASLETVAAPSGSSVSTYRFPFAGRLAFAQLPGLDLLSFDALAFRDVALEMTYDPTAAQPRAFRFATERATLEESDSGFRPGSLFAALPLTLRGLVTGSAAPSSLGFANVKLVATPVAQLGSSWYGIALDLDLGTPGALAAEAGWSATLLVAWAPGSRRVAAGPPAVAAGMRLPGSAGAEKTLSLQGVIGLSVDQIELSYTAAKEEQASAYLLRMTEIGLSLLGLKFPPGYGTAFYLFGNPTTTTQRSGLGWYAALAKQP